MKTSAIVQLIGFIVLAVVVVSSFRWIFPHNHAYGSIALVAYATIFGCFAPMNPLKILLFGISYSVFLVADSKLGIGILASVKTSESLVFPLVSGVILIAFMFAGFALRKIIVRHEASSNH